MTTNPKARKFRIRKPGETSVPSPRLPNPQPGPRTDDGFGDTAYPTARKAEPAVPAGGAAPAAPPAATATETPVEGMTGRQLRIARRLAHHHGLDAKDDADAVRLLREKGIDPLDRSNLLKLVAPEQAAARTPALPQTVPQPDRRVPAHPKPAAPVGHAAEIAAIQRDIARRRQRRLGWLGARLALFVLIPTMLAGFYFYNVATPMYATNSEFVIQQADQPSGGGLGGMLAGTGMATSQDSITVQSYLKSRESMLRLEEDLGYKAHFSRSVIDPIQRLDPGATNEQAYRHYADHVKIGYDPTEGIVKMEVIAADPETSAAFSRALIGYAEEQVDNLSLRLREDQMQGATESFREAEAKMEASQARILDLQEKLGVLDPASESASVMQQIAGFEVQLAEKRLQLQQLLDNPSPNQARVQGVEGDIARLQSLIDQLRAPLTENGGETTSLARIGAELRLAEVDLETRTLMMQEALQQLEAARVEANRQVRYLSTGVNPIPPDEATYPRAFENTLLTFFVFSGVYLLLSLTASILREQVSG